MDILRSLRLYIRYCGVNSILLALNGKGKHEKHKLLFLKIIFHIYIIEKDINVHTAEHNKSFSLS